DVLELPALRPQLHGPHPAANVAEDLGVPTEQDLVAPAGRHRGRRSCWSQPNGDAAGAERHHQASGDDRDDPGAHDDDGSESEVHDSAHYAGARPGMPCRSRRQRAISARNSCSNVPASNDVTSPESYCGCTSTRSKPTNSMPRNPRTRRKASRLLGPPTSGVPVPGAKPGSTKSMSKVRKTGPAPIRCRTSARTDSMPRCSNSSVGTRWSPSARAPPRSSEPYNEPRMPSCTARRVSIKPSSMARLHQVPWVWRSPQ